MISKKTWSFLTSYYKALEESKGAENCIACQKCVTKCPQGIDIPMWMETIKEFALSVKKEIQN